MSQTLNQNDCLAERFHISIPQFESAQYAEKAVNTSTDSALLLTIIGEGLYMI